MILPDDLTGDQDARASGRFAALAHDRKAEWRLQISVWRQPSKRTQRRRALEQRQARTVWRDEETGIDCRCCPDFLLAANHRRPSQREDASSARIRASAAIVSYHVQDAYSNGVYQAIGEYP